jgi:hypothetical protein
MIEAVGERLHRQIADHFALSLCPRWKRGSKNDGADNGGMLHGGLLKVEAQR